MLKASGPLPSGVDRTTNVAIQDSKKLSRKGFLCTLENSKALRNGSDDEANMCQPFVVSFVSWTGRVDGAGVASEREH